MDKWWKEAVFYEIYMPSFCDGNGDGIGDFLGIISKLDYLKDLGVNGIWLTPFYKSPKVDNGYDIEDYYEIDPDHGTMEDFTNFIEEAHKRNIKVIADLVLNHTSNRHKWFLESKSSIDNSKRDWYIWKDNPNNWESFFSGSAWEYDETTNQYYYHAFAKEQVDLNWSNNEVKEAMFDVIKFWLDKGIDGFRLDVINFLTVKDHLQDNPYDENGEQLHLYDKDQDGILEIIEELKKLTEEYDDKFLVGEVGSEDLDVIKKYIGKKRLDAAFNFNLGSIEQFDVDKIFEEIRTMEKKFDIEQLPTLFFSSHDMSRHISRFGDKGIEEDRAKNIATLILTAKGIPFIYNGEEIGMRDYIANSIHEMKDIQGILAYSKAIDESKNKNEALKIANSKCRDKSRSPIQWDNTEYAGFSSTKPWININKNKEEINVKNQLSDPNSILNHYKNLIKLRSKYNSLNKGVYEELNKNNNLIYYLKKYNEEKSLILINFDRSKVKFDLKKYKDFNFIYSNKRNNIDFSREMIEILPNESIIMIKSEEN
ncbi:glucohydrolase [Vulcanibacillus modesticaldus]|uniref:Glucohydrolase n=1 Tax=Vulcanibacillus modesticaldus TaxID=337097 RepID=A0A1D2YU01_9BACI|nr:alpha-glucosidase [Vulcanibacillus modesticaldus]OEF99167.1 glucohydrolase [Vulcanibacillus modesticaldus]